MTDPKAEVALRLQVLVDIASGIGRTLLEQAPILPEWQFRQRVQFLLELLEGPIEALRAPAPSASAWHERQLDPTDLPF